MNKMDGEIFAERKENGMSFCMVFRLQWRSEEAMNHEEKGSVCENQKNDDSDDDG